MTMPSFLVIGVCKSGTTSLHGYLRQHPQVFVPPIKEPRYFATDGRPPVFGGPDNEEVAKPIVHDLKTYEALFAPSRDAKAVGELSPWYIYLPDTPARIRHHIPDVKLIAILRDPAERAHSTFVGIVRNGQETEKDFAAALRMEEQRIRDHWEPLWHYRKMGFYFEQLRRYFDLFPASQIQIHLYEDYRDRPDETFREMFRFIGADPSFRVDHSTRTNESRLPRSRRLQTFLREPNKFRSTLGKLVPAGARRKIATALYRGNMYKPPLDPRDRADLVDGYREDILKLQDLIGRDLSGWLR